MAREKCGLLVVPRTAPVQLMRYVYTAHVLEIGMQSTLCLRYERLVTWTELQKWLSCFPTRNIVTCILCMDFATAKHVLLLKNNKRVFPTEGFRLEVYLLAFTRQCMRLAVFQVLLCSLKGRWHERLTRENILEMVQRSPRLSTRRMASHIGVSRMQVWWTLHEEDLYPYHDQRVQHLEPGDHAQCFDLCHWITAYPELLSVILFTDETSFTRDSINNSQNVHTWSMKIHMRHV